MIVDGRFWRRYRADSPCLGGLPHRLGHHRYGADGGGTGAIVPPGPGRIGPTWAMAAVIAGWVIGWSAIGAWKMATRDA